MSVFLIPMTNIPQTFNITLANVDYVVTCRWNDADQGGWVLDISDANSSTIIATNLPLVCGTDLLDGLEYLGINGQLYVYTNGDETLAPTLDNLGVDSNLYFSTEVSDG